MFPVLTQPALNTSLLEHCKFLSVSTAHFKSIIIAVEQNSLWTLSWFLFNWQTLMSAACPTSAKMANASTRKDLTPVNATVATPSLGEASAKVNCMHQHKRMPVDSSSLKDTIAASSAHSFHDKGLCVSLYQHFYPNCLFVWQRCTMFEYPCCCDN